MNDEITAPPPWQLADALVLAQVEATLLGEAAPVRLGRYRIERDLGAGGMGRLVLAFDPDLQRHVALKLVAPPLASSAEARRRIVAEARAMARLSEPHVAQVYEVGELDGQVFVAMEFVDGHDLRQWLAAAPRRWSQVLALFLQAGAGLAAAHDVGITHRDFKPENVMVDQHGRARVIDFGLAGAAADPRAEPAAGGVGLTRTGAFVGTPGYMPPEQWDGELVDARADQFAFCVALFEALVGARPFDAATPERLREALRGGPTPAWPRAVPRWILAPLLRGLHAEPAARWSDLRALRRARDPGRRRRRTTAVATMGAGAGLLALAAFAAHDPCRDAGAAISSAWDAQQRASVRAAARAADAGWGDRSGAAVVERLDAATAAWSEVARSVCQAERADDRARTAARGCLAHAGAQLRATIDESREPSASLWLGAAARAELLPDAHGCAEPPRLTAWSVSTDALAPIDAALRQGEAALGEGSVRGEPESLRTAPDRARAAAAAAIRAAEQLEHEPSLARALLLAGRIELVEGEHARAEPLLRRGLALARRADDAALGAALAAELVHVISRERERFDEAEDLAREALGSIIARGRPPLLLARLSAHRASAMARADTVDHDGAVALHEEVAALLEGAVGPQHPASIVEQGNLGVAQSYAGQHERARTTLAAAIEAASAALGAEHPRTAALHGAWGLAQMRAGALEPAEHALRRSLQLRAAVLADDHPQLDDARYNLALVLRRRGQHAEAAALLAQGLAHVRARRDRDDPLLGPWWVALAESQLEQGDTVAAQASFDAALRLFERGGASGRDYARVRSGAARARVGEDPAGAWRLAQQARADALDAGATAMVASIDAWLAGLAAPADP